MTDDIPSTPIPGVLDVETALKQLDEEQAIPVEKRAEHPMAQESYEFTVDLVGGNGQKITGTFANKILTLDERMRVGLLQSKMVRGIQWNLLDDETRYLVSMISHLALSLTKKPLWWNLATMKNTRILERVYGEVARHEAFFRGADEAQATGE